MSDDTFSSRRSRRNYNADDDDEDDRSRSRRSRRAQRDDDDEEEETTTRSSRRSRRAQDDEEEEEVSASSRRSRRKVEEDEEEDSAPPSRSSRSAVTINTSSSSAPAKKATVLGATFQSMNDARRKRIQQAILDGMAKYAEQKFGRKRQAPKASKARNAMDDYEIYLRSVKAKIKTCQDKINVVVKQKREIDEKLKKAEEEKEKQEKILQDAEDEKDAAEVEGRDPKLPSGFIVPQTAKKAAAGSGFANLVMKASAQLWEDKFMAMRAKKGGSDGQPEWMNKTKSRSDKVLVNVGKKPGHKKEEEQKPAWGANLKKAEPRRKIGEPKNDDGSQPAFAKVGLRKTQKKEEDDEQGSRKINFKEQMVKKAGGGSSRRRRGGDDSD